jgi:hypothetical protein
MRYLGKPRQQDLRQGREAGQQGPGPGRRAGDPQQLDNPQATPRARRELLTAVTDAAWTGQPDLERLDRAYRDVFEPGAGLIRKAVGHPSAPFTTEAMTGLTEARLEAVTALTAGNVTDEALIQARDTHVFATPGTPQSSASWPPQRPPGPGHLYEPVTAEDTLANCCGHLLTAIGLEIMHPETAERLRRARAFQRKPAAATFGLLARLPGRADEPQEPPAEIGGKPVHQRRARHHSREAGAEQPR